MKVITLARKPILGSVFESACTQGTGGLHVDVLRIPLAVGETISVGYKKPDMHAGWKRTWMLDPQRWEDYKSKAVDAAHRLGRWPSNIIFDSVDVPGSLERSSKVIG